MSEETKIPDVRAYAERAGGGTWDLVVLVCPFCHKTHMHGAGTTITAPEGPDPEYYGLRQAHCQGVKRPESYNLIPAEVLA